LSPLTERLAPYRGARVLVTGALGFIGSNLARRLVALGANVCGIDSCQPGTGANRFNLDGVVDRMRLLDVDQRDRDALRPVVADREVIFNLVGRVSHLDSMRDPLGDMELNVRAHLTLLDVCRDENPRVRVVYASSRQVYGRPEFVPTDERHPVRPADINGINKAAAEQYHLLYHRVYGLRASVLRLTNTYGPRMLVKHDRQTFLGWFIRQALDGDTIRVFGDGTQLRDFTYVDDAVDAFLLAGQSDAAVGNVFNLAGTEPVSLLDVTRLLVELAGRGGYALVPFPPEKKAIDVGSVYSDDSRLRRVLGWGPRVDLAEGLARTLEFYRVHRAMYWSAECEETSTQVPPAGGLPLGAAP
jgi:UDP-glucose 4-epimerase